MKVENASAPETLQDNVPDGGSAIGGWILETGR